MSISVIIPNYNSSLLIERALKSVMQQEAMLLQEIILVDDGSTDDSIEKATRLQIPKLTILNQQNQGPSAARNKGIELAQSKYIAFLDADDYWKPGFLKETFNFLENHEEAIAVSTGQLHIFPGKEDFIIPRFLRKDSSIIFDKPVLLENFYEFWAEYNHVCTGSVLMRADIVKKTRGQRIDLRITEDVEFWAYLATFGKWGFIPEILFVSDGGEIARQQGWQKKNQIRWASATNMEDWERRIVQNMPDGMFTSYQNARGRIAKRLAYSMILSGRGGQAKVMVNEYGKNFPGDRMSKLLKFASKNPITWIIICNLVVIKESIRKL
jgi:glycosyltransferase involved in cell wall biosynthesis